MEEFYGPETSGVTGTSLLVLAAWKFERRSGVEATPLDSD